MANSTIAGQMLVDGNGNSIQTATTLQFTDGASTAVSSPIASVGITPQAFRVPAGALVFTVRADADTRIGITATSLDGTTGNEYFPITANTTFCFPCAARAGSDIYVRAASGTATIYFCFEMM
jgi:hypothetical protein